MFLCSGDFAAHKQSRLISFYLSQVRGHRGTMRLWYLTVTGSTNPGRIKTKAVSAKL